MTLSKGTLLKAVLLGTMAVPMLTVSALGQQEVDPAWYDPWAPSAKVAVGTAHVKATDSKPRRLSSVSAARPKDKKQARAESARHSERAQAMASAQPLR